MEVERIKTVAILGAGPAGLATAHQILSASKDYEVIILEQAAQVGGISQTVQFGQYRIDLGGHRLFTRSARVSDWWQSIRMNQAILFSAANPQLMQVDRASSILFQGKKYSYPVSVTPAEIKKFGFCKSAMIFLSYVKAQILRPSHEAISLEELYIQQFGKYMYELFFKRYTEKVWGHSPKDIYPNWGKQRTQGLNIGMLLMDWLKAKHGAEESRTLSKQFYYPEYGIGQLWENVSAEIEQMGGRVITRAKVCKIVMEGNKVAQIVAETNEGIKNIPVDCCVSSIPLSDLCICLDQCPMSIASVAKALPYRDMVVVGIAVPLTYCGNALLEDGKLIKDMWLYIQDPSVQVGRIQIENNWSLRMSAGSVVLVAEYFCQEGEAIWNEKNADRVTRCMDELRQLQVVTEEAEPIDATVQRIHKAYPAYWGAYAQLGVIQSWLDSVENLYCVGRNGQHKYNNMDHSVLSGIIAADLVIGKGTGKKQLWSVNTGDEYQESNTV